LCIVIWPEASNAQNNIAAVSAGGRRVCVDVAGIDGSQQAGCNEYVFPQIARAICLGEPSDQDRETIAAGIAGIAPKGSLGDMIAVQMLAYHDVAVDCYRDALNSNFTSSLRREHLNQASKL
jgi:hypothetical protein